MKCVLNKGIALRSWERIPWSCYVWGHTVPQRLEPEMFELLSSCDGTHDLDPSPQLDALIAQGIVHEAARGETWDSWCAPRSYKNRLFHSLNWAITGRCNYRCRHCFMAADNGPMLGQFTWDECLALLDECEAVGIQSLTLTGGEPLLHPHFMDLIRECARRRITVGEINTNGSLLTAEMLDEIHALGQDPEIKVSFDGIGHHDWLRGVDGAEDEALSAMRLAKERGFKVRSQTNVHHGNLDAMRDTVRLLDDMGVDEVRIIRTTETPRWRENSDDATLGIIEYYDAMRDLTAQLLADDLSIAVDVWQFAYWNPRRGTYAFHPAQIACSRYRDEIPACKGARGDVAVSFNGEIYPCNQTSGTFAAMGKSFGNVHTTPLRKLLSGGEYYDTVMLPVSEIRAHNEAPCSACPWWRVCGGGCRAIALAFTKDYRRFDPAKCAFFAGGYIAQFDELFARAPRAYRCINDLGDLPRSGDAALMERVVKQLGPYA
ncbi:MAG: radical SAM protein [Coriobacteriia bacterium]|nr:radical SAM protein [Coriobacteriia bacterium]MBS5477268.1 radical SAM protein [Coriobacteriia bacterium]